MVIAAATPVPAAPPSALMSQALASVLAVLSTVRLVRVLSMDTSLPT